MPLYRDWQVGCAIGNQRNCAYEIANFFMRQYGHSTTQAWNKDIRQAIPMNFSSSVTLFATAMSFVACAFCWAYKYSTVLQKVKSPIQVALFAINMKTIATALEILCAFTDGSGHHSVSELADSFGMARSQVSRILATLRDAGWLEQHPKTRLYSVGVAAYAFGSRFVQQHPLTRQALPILRSVVDRSGFHATLSTLDGLRPLYLLGIEGPVPIDFTSDFGAYFPLHATAPGKVMAAFARPHLREQMLTQAPFARLTIKTIVDAEPFERELDAIARRGYAISDGERLPGIGGLAVPALDHSGELIAAVGTAFPTQMVSAAEYEYQVEILRGAACALAERFEGSPRVRRLKVARHGYASQPVTFR